MNSQYEDILFATMVDVNSSFYERDFTSQVSLQSIVLTRNRNIHSAKTETRSTKAAIDCISAFISIVRIRLVNEKANIH